MPNRHGSNLMWRIFQWWTFEKTQKMAVQMTTDTVKNAKMTIESVVNFVFFWKAHHWKIRHCTQNVTQCLFPPLKTQVLWNRSAARTRDWLHREGEAGALQAEAEVHGRHAGERRLSGGLGHHGARCVDGAAHGAVVDKLTEALARLSDNRATYQNFLTLASRGRDLANSGLAFWDAFKIRQMLGIKNVGRGRISTLLPMPEATAGNLQSPSVRLREYHILHLCPLLRESRNL